LRPATNSCDIDRFAGPDYLCVDFGSTYSSMPTDRHDAGRADPQ
jgi:hypothetical protein